MKRFALLLAVLSACAATPAPTPQPAPAAPPAASATPPPASIESKTAKLEKIDGYFPLYWDAEHGKLLMQIPRMGQDFILVSSLSAGVGSNPIGLDRNQTGESHLVHFERVGPRVLLIETNTRFRALSDNPTERLAAEEAFARSILWGFKVEASDANSALVDATDFFLSDLHHVAERLRMAHQGNYSVDLSRSAIYLPRTKGFPLNTEVEATLTFVTHDFPGALIRGVTPSPEAVTVREHDSLVALPPPGYTPRRADPRVGIFSINFFDFATPFNQPLERQWIVRHRLQKKDPNAAISDPVQPIIYYVDSGAPKPVRDALIEGASWWNQAFEAAGFRNAFQVKVLPPGADPMDIRYNMINWVDRAQRGWSYCAAVIDPRTGEIIKGNVTRDALRIRQDVLIGRGLIPQFQDLGDRALASLDPTTSPSAMALARIRQLAAHETGHTLGLGHNFAASSYGRASVMDYPSPYVKITNGKLDLSDAYATGIGSYDKWAIRYAYAQFPPGSNEDAELDKIASSGPLYITDRESRPVSGANPLASMWDNGSDPLEMLRHEFDVRRIALSQFGLRNIPVGAPLSTLEEIFVPLYLHHRYQLEAAAKTIGGVDYTYTVKENGSLVPQPIRQIVPAARQREAIGLLMSTLDPSFLQVPQRIVDLIPPRGDVSVTSNTELFEHRTFPLFDPLSAANACADITLGALLDPARAARMEEFHAENAANPGFTEVLDDIVKSVTRSAPGMSGAILRTSGRLTATRLMELASDSNAEAQVRAEASEALRQMAKLLSGSSSDEAETAYRQSMRDDIARFLARPDQPRSEPKPPAVPPGEPIGN